jgi:hypothetical protein
LRLSERFFGIFHQTLNLSVSPRGRYKGKSRRLGRAILYRVNEGHRNLLPVTLVYSTKKIKIKNVYSTKSASCDFSMGVSALYGKGNGMVEHPPAITTAFILGAGLERACAP